MEKIFENLIKQYIIYLMEKNIGKKVTINMRKFKSWCKIHRNIDIPTNGYGYLFWKLLKKTLYNMGWTVENHTIYANKTMTYATLFLDKKHIEIHRNIKRLV